MRSTPSSENICSEMADLKQERHFVRNRMSHLEMILNKRFRDLDQILSDLHDKKLEKAIKWADNNLNKLKIFDSDLPILVHKVSFCHMLKKAHEVGEGPMQIELLETILRYAAAKMTQFFSKFNLQIIKLMEELTFVNDLENTMYQSSKNSSN